ncbi:response regulator [Hydrogenophaga sp. PBL-H3]|uniref:response regulator n=1 Tax=Hydrogenophaga sp. PBL-H3 TaxID=434010 RepID=UPI001F234C99|nr:response regulator [Hydrogenophaga sp. PBL-H3]
MLTIDDNENDLLFTRIALQRCGVDYDIRAFERAQEALSLLATDPAHGIDLILLDINMPVMDGFAFLRAFEALPAAQRGHAVVVMLSSSSDPADRSRAAAHACVRGFVSKPLDKDTAAGLVRLIGPR